MKRGENGQLLIEFALLAPVMMLLIFIALDFGIVLIRSATADDAVRQGADEAAHGIPQATVVAYVVDHSGGVLTADAVEVCQPDSDHVRVSATWVWKWIAGPLVTALHGVAPTDLTLRPSADRRLDLDAGATPAARSDAPPCQ